VKRFTADLDAGGGLLDRDEPHLLRQTATDVGEQARRTALRDLDIFNRRDFFVQHGLLRLEQLDLFNDFLQALDLLLNTRQLLLMCLKVAVLGHVAPYATTDRSHNDDKGNLELTTEYETTPGFTCWQEIDTYHQSRILRNASPMLTAATGAISCR